MEITGNLEAAAGRAGVGAAAARLATAMTGIAATRDLLDTPSNNRPWVTPSAGGPLHSAKLERLIAAASAARGNDPALVKAARCPWKRKTTCAPF